MAGKTDRQFFFEVQLNWIEETKGALTAKEADGLIHVGTPAKFGGKGKPWTPELLFLSSISSCYMTTYIAFAKKAGFEISHFDCNTIGQIEIVEAKYKFTNINLYPKIYIARESLREKATAVLEKTNKSCLIVNTINAAVFFHSEILLDKHPKLAKA
ncbi:MAG: OsmC family protein [Chitinophagaceae bacterium]|nr:OsmC family protein [Chitinophagaceae bacterium]